MTPEAADYLRKARIDLDEAGKIAAIGLANVAGRSASYAAFHTAEALIIERTGKVAVSHKGVRVEFARLAKDEPAISSRSLSRDKSPIGGLRLSWLAAEREME